MGSSHLAPQRPTGERPSLRLYAPEVAAPRGARRAFLPYLTVALTTALVGGWTIPRTGTLTHDSVIFIRMARQLVGDDNASSVELTRAKRSAPVRAALDWLDARLPAIRAIEAEHQHPGYAMTVALVERLGGRWLGADSSARWGAAAQIASLLAAVALVLGVCRFGTLLFGEMAGWAAAMMVALAPPMIRTYCDALSDPAALALLVWSTIALFPAINDRSTRAALGCGLCAGVGYLVRPEAAQVAALGFVYLVGKGVMTPRDRWIWLRQAVFLAFAFAALAAPYIALKGSLLTKKAHLLDPAAWPTAPASSALSDANAAPRADAPPPSTPSWSQKIVHRIAPYVSAYLIYLAAWARDVGIVFLLPVFVGGLARLSILRDRPVASIAVCAAWINAAILPLVLSVASQYLDNRHAMASAILTAPWVWPGLLVIAGGAAAILVRNLDRRESWARGLATTMLLAGFAAMLYVGVRHPLNYQRAGHRAAGAWLHDRIAPGEELIDPGLLAGFYANADERNVWTRDPSFDGKRLDALLAAKPRVAYLVFNDYFLKGMGIRGGLEGIRGDRRVVAVAEFPVSLDPSDGERLQVYRVEGGGGQNRAASAEAQTR